MGDGLHLEPMDNDYVLTPQKAEFVRQIASGVSPYAASLAVGATGKGTASRWLSDENLRNALKQAAIEQGNTPEDIGRTLREAREANRYELDRFGEVKDLGADHASRIKATDVLVKLMGGYPKPGDGMELHAQNVLVIRADQGLATSDPFAIDGSESEGTHALPMPEQRPESHPVRSTYDKFDELC